MTKPPSTRPHLLGIAAATAVIALLAFGSGGSVGVALGVRASPAPLRVVTALEPGAVLYGDPIAADVEVEYDQQRIAPSSIRVVPSFVPFVVRSAPLVQPLRPGVVRLRYSLLCVTAGCLPTGKVRRLRLAPVKVTARAGTRTVTAVGHWPSLRISSRLVPSDLSGRVRFRSASTPPSPRYRLEPGPLSVGLLAVAVVCTLGAIVIGGWGLARLVRRRQATGLSRLELAIAYVRDSTRRSGSDRRRALGLLAETVRDHGEPDLSAAAAETAWSKAPPTPSGATQLAERAADVRTGTR